MKKAWKLVCQYPIVILFVVAVLGITVADMVTPDLAVSELENRELAQNPELTWEGLMDLSYANDYEAYVSDQFLLRQDWITVKSRVEALLGKVENNGVIYGSNGYLFEKLFLYDKEKVDRNLDYLTTFAENCPHPLSIMMIPNSYEVYSDLLPAGTEPINQEALFTEYYERFAPYANCVDVTKPLKASDLPYLYYRTDHHWTSYGAYLAYETYMRSIGREPVERSTVGEVKMVPDFLGTYFAKCKQSGVIADTIVYHDVKDIEMTIRSALPNGELIETAYDSLYDLEKFGTYDKYAAFLYSNNDLTVIRNTNPSEDAKGKSICVLKDSYGNCFVPFLTQSYETVSVIDIRFFNEALSEYLAANAFDQVLVMYNFSTFTTENIARIAY